MENISLKQNVKRFMINDDPNNIFEFDPHDAGFADRFYKTIKEIDAKQVEYNQRADALAAQPEIGTDGLPANLGGSIDLVRELCEYMRGRIDYLFGAGSSQKLFGDALSLDAIGNFFNAMTPIFAAARGEKIESYSNTVTAKKRAMR
jgi:hypothetical protein